MGIQLILDNKHVRIKNAPRSVLRKIEAITSYLVAGHYFSPAFKNHRWDGKEHLMKFSSKYGYRAPSGLFTNISNRLKREGIKFTVKDKRRKPESKIDFDWNEEIVLRPYQQDCVEAALAEPVPGNGILVMPIRSGKTITAGGIIKRLGVRTVFCVTSQLLLYQAKKSFEELFKEPIGMIGDSIWEEERVTVATVQSLDRARGGTYKREEKEITVPPDPRYASLISKTDLMIQDECFPAGTLVGDKKIEEIEAGDFVDSFDEEKMQFCRRRVLSTFKRAAKYLVEISFANGRQIVCTPEHPFLTQDGWKDARKLTSNDAVYRAAREEDGEINSKNELPHLQEGDSYFRRSKRKIRPDWSSLLLERMFETVRVGGVIEDDGRDEQEIRFRPDEKEQSNKETGSSREDKQDACCDGTQAEDSRRKRKRAYRAAKNVARVAKQTLLRMATGVQHRNRKRLQNLGTTDALQDRHSAPDSGGSDRGRRWVTYLFEGSSVGQEKGKVLEKVGVEIVEILEPSSDGKFGEVCPDGFVYNLEVEDTNTYLVDGFVAHNCHHLKGKSWHAVMQDFDSYYKLGLSATVYLDNEKECEKGVIWLQGCCGNVRFRISSSRLIKEGWLMQPEIQLYKVNEPTEIADHRWSKSLQSEAIYENEIRNELICKLAIEQVDNDKKVLIVANRIAQIEALAEKISEQGIMFATITGRVPGRKRQELIEDYVEGHYKILLGTVFGEGVDLPSVEVVINAEGGRDVKSTVQKMRNLTPKKGKKEAIYIDFVDLMNPYFATHSLERLRVYRAEKAFRVKICGDL